MRQLLKRKTVRDSLLALGILSILFVSSILLGNHMFKEQLINQQSSLLENKMTLLLKSFSVTELLQKESLTSEEKTLLKNYIQIDKDRLTLLNAQGDILYDTSGDAQGESRKNRPEIQNILDGAKVGISLRVSTTQGNKEFLYVAYPIYQKNKRIGFVRISERLDTFSQPIRLFQHFILFLLGGIFLILSLIILRLIKLKNEPLETILPLLKKNLETPDQRTVLMKDSREFDEFYQIINQVSSKMNATYQAYISTTAQFHQFINGLTIGVFIIHKDGTLAFINPALQSLLNSQNPRGKNYEEVFSNSELLLPIQTILSTKQSGKEEIVLKNNKRTVLELSLNYVEELPHSEIQLIGATYDLTRIRELEQIQSDFVGNVSHELKTPVTSFLGFTETLLDGAMADEETTKNFLEIMQKDALRLQQLIHEILQLSRDKQAFDEKKQWLPIQKIIGDLLETYQPQIQKKELSVSIIGDKDVLFPTNIELFYPILKNLIENAIQYSMMNKKILLEYLVQEETLLLKVQDFGIGIDSVNLPRIFERFFRVDKARSRNTGGTGLGLSIVKNYTQMLGGTIEVESQLGVGTTFLLRFPMLPAKI